MTNLRCPDCGMFLSGGGHKHVCMADTYLEVVMTMDELAEIIANVLLRKLKGGTIKKIDIDTIRQACRNDEPLVELVLRRVVYKVG